MFLCKAAILVLAALLSITLLVLKAYEFADNGACCLAGECRGTTDGECARVGGIFTADVSCNTSPCSSSPTPAPTADPCSAALVNYSITDITVRCDTSNVQRQSFAIVAADGRASGCDPLEASVDLEALCDGARCESGDEARPADVSLVAVGGSCVVTTGRVLCLNVTIEDGALLEVDWFFGAAAPFTDIEYQSTAAGKQTQFGNETYTPCDADCRSSLITYNFGPLEATCLDAVDQVTLNISLIDGRDAICEGELVNTSIAARCDADFCYDVQTVLGGPSEVYKDGVTLVQQSGIGPEPLGGTARLENVLISGPEPLALIVFEYQQDWGGATSTEWTISDTEARIETTNSLSYVDCPAV
jgi:hypothetical protein